MRAPGFWYTGGPLSVALAPLGSVWAAGARLRASLGHPARAPLPVVCVGNLVVGGAGKTPVAISLANRLPGAHLIARGHGGSLAGPVMVELERHDHREVGDEALLTARVAPTWVARDRLAGACAAAAQGARCVILDDGYQDPSLVKDVSLLVVDGHVGFGSRRCMPAGPLREPVASGLARAQAVVLLGEDKTGIAKTAGEIPVLRARLEPETEAGALAGHRVFAFAGIGRPDKFFRLLEALDAQLVERRTFPDHHRYTPAEIGRLIDAADSQSAALMTTTKDFVRLPPHLRERVAVLRVAVAWDDEAALTRVLAPALP